MAHSGGFMTDEDEAFEDLAKRQGDWGLQGSRKHQIMRYAENAERNAVIEATVLAEREACAQLCEEWLGPTKDKEIHIAKAIRAKGQA